MKRLAYLLPAIIVTQTFTGCALFFDKDPKEQVEVPKEDVAAVKTDKGVFVIEFYSESAPVAVENFKKLIGQKFYDGLTFHRIINAPGLNIVQGGCPRGDGSGGPGWTIEDEYTNPNQRKHLRGTVAMARADIPDSSGSQFYICLKPQPHLDGQYTTFGGVIQGMDVVDLLQIGDVMTTIRLEAKSKYVKAAEN
jgi:cyclophilin family peptidyl-prolyl cis-trans isomerase